MVHATSAASFDSNYWQQIKPGMKRIGSAGAVTNLLIIPFGQKLAMSLDTQAQTASSELAIQGKMHLPEMLLMILVQHSQKVPMI